MQTLNASLRTRGEAYEPLPGMIKELSDVGAEIRYGELSLLFAAPGVGKSVLAMAIALGCGVPTYYFSTDTSRFDMGSWCAAHASGDLVNAVKKTMEVEPTFYDERVKSMNPHVMWDWETSPDFTRIEEELEAFVVAFGDYPHLIVIDNLRNLYSTEDEVRAQQHNMQQLKDMAASTQSATLVLHHAVGAMSNGDTTPTQRDIESKIDKFPGLIISLSRGKPELGGDLRCAILKNRGGPANASGRFKVFVPFHTATMQVGRKGNMFNFFANVNSEPIHGDVYIKNGKAYTINSDLDLIGVKTGKSWGNAVSERDQWPSNPRILVIREGVKL